MSHSSDEGRLAIRRATFEFEQAAIKPLIYLNGGAIVAALTYAGHEESFSDPASLTGPLYAWLGGLVCSIGAVFLGYLSQYSFLKAEQKERGAKKAKDEGNEQTKVEQLRLKRNRSAHGRHARLAVWIVCGLSLAAFAAGSICGIGSLAQIAQGTP